MFVMIFAYVVSLPSQNNPLRRNRWVNLKMGKQTWEGCRASLGHRESQQVARSQQSGSVTWHRPLFHFICCFSEPMSLSPQTTVAYYHSQVLRRRQECISSFRGWEIQSRHQQLWSPVRPSSWFPGGPFLAVFSNDIRDKACSVVSFLRTPILLSRCHPYYIISPTHTSVPTSKCHHIRDQVSLQNVQRHSIWLIDVPRMTLRI